MIFLVFIKKNFFFFLILIILYSETFLTDCKLKCKTCEKINDNCLECNGQFRNIIIPNCNCTKGYYEPMNSDILNCLSNMFYFIYFNKIYFFLKKKILIATIYFIIECSDKCQTCDYDESNCTLCVGKYRVAPDCIC